MPFFPTGGNRKRGERYPREPTFQDSEGWELCRFNVGMDISGEPGTKWLLSLLARPNPRKCPLSKKQQVLSPWWGGERGGKMQGPGLNEDRRIEPLPSILLQGFSITIKVIYIQHITYSTNRAGQRSTNYHPRIPLTQK